MKGNNFSISGISIILANHFFIMLSVIVVHKLNVFVI